MGLNPCFLCKKKAEDKKLHHQRKNDTKNTKPWNSTGIESASTSLTPASTSLTPASTSLTPLVSSKPANDDIHMRLDAMQKILGACTERVSSLEFIIEKMNKRLAPANASSQPQAAKKKKSEPAIINKIKFAASALTFERPDANAIADGDEEVAKSIKGNSEIYFRRYQQYRSNTIAGVKSGLLNGLDKINVATGK